MKKIFFIFFLANFNLCAATISPPGVGNGSIIIEQGNMTIFGKMVDTSWSVPSFVAALGKPSTTNGNYYIYDSAGVFALNHYDSSVYHFVTEFHVRFGMSEGVPSAFDPAKYYSGAVIVENFPVTTNTTFAELKTALPNYQFENTYGNWVEGKYMGLYILAFYEPGETKLLWLAIGRYDD